MKDQILKDNGLSVKVTYHVDAEIKDVTFENLSVSFTLRGNGEMQSHYLFNAIDERAKLVNVTASGTFKIVKQDGVKLQSDYETNFQHGGGASENIVSLVMNATKL